MEAHDAKAWREQADGVRRERIVHAMARVAYERGFAGASVAAVCSSAKVSGQAFYGCFASREQCFLAVLDEGHARVSRLVSRAFAGKTLWLEAIRAAQIELLCFFDAEPQLARVCIVESLATGPWALERREEHVTALTRLIVKHWRRLGPRDPYPFASVAVMVSSLGLIQKRLLAAGEGALIELLGPLMGIAAAPYLEAEAVAAEVRYSARLAREIASADRTPPTSGHQTPSDLKLPEPLADPRAYRARECVLYLADHPGASNRQVARAIGIARDNQISTVLSRLAAANLLIKQPAKPGGANAWRLSSKGDTVATALHSAITAKERGVKS
jgi:AcrR family transcriptional regulator